LQKSNRDQELKKAASAAFFCLLQGLTRVIENLIKKTHENYGSDYQRFDFGPFYRNRLYFVVILKCSFSNL